MREDAVPQLLAAVLSVDDPEGPHKVGVVPQFAAGEVADFVHHGVPNAVWKELRNFKTQ